MAELLQPLFCPYRQYAESSVYCVLMNNLIGGRPDYQNRQYTESSVYCVLMNKLIGGRPGFQYRHYKESSVYCVLMNKLIGGRPGFQYRQNTESSVYCVLKNELIVRVVRTFKDGFLQRLYETVPSIVSPMVLRICCARMKENR